MKRTFVISTGLLLAGCGLELPDYQGQLNHDLVPVENGAALEELWLEAVPEQDESSGPELGIIARLAASSSIAGSVRRGRDRGRLHLGSGRQE